MATSLDSEIAGIAAGGLRTTAKDLPRLCTRVRVTATGRVLKDREDRADDAAPLTNLERLDVCVAVVAAVAAASETSQRASELADELHRFRSEQERASDLELVLQELLEHVVGAQSATGRVLSLLHQGVVLCGAYHLRAGLGGSDVTGAAAAAVPMTKDIRSARGWLVDVEAANGVVAVTHTRVEAGVMDAFEMTWALHVTLSPSTGTVGGTSLQVTNLSTTDVADAARRSELRRVFCAGRVIVA